MNARILDLQRSEFENNKTTSANSPHHHHHFNPNRIETLAGVPTEKEIRKRANTSTVLLVLEDLMLTLSGNFLDTLFTKGSHNWGRGVSVLLVCQHLFPKILCVPRNNSHYLVLLRNPQGALQIRNLAHQLFPEDAHHMLAAYRDACAENFSYLIIDLHPSTRDDMRLKTHIYPWEQPIIIYQ
jgi:hypothetical protein